MTNLKEMNLNELKDLEKRAYAHLQDFYADEEEEFEEALKEWKTIVKELKSRGLNAKEVVC